MSRVGERRSALPQSTRMTREMAEEVITAGESLATGSNEARRRPRRRDADATTQRILQAAIVEFAEHGLTGARVDAIARRADTNMRMLYHYFGSKIGLYTSVLETVFADIRQQEERLNLRDLQPLPAMMKLFDFTFSHFERNPGFIRILASENLLEAHYLKQSKRVAAISSPLMDAICEVLARGRKFGVFRTDIDPLQIYVTMVSLSYFHISNAPTLSHLFGANLTSARWRSARRKHASEVIRSYLRKE